MGYLKGHKKTESNRPILYSYKILKINVDLIISFVR